MDGKKSVGQLSENDFNLIHLGNYMQERNICMFIKFTRHNGKSQWFITVRQLKDRGSYCNKGTWKGGTLIEAFSKLHEAMGKQMEFFWRKGK